MRIDHRGLQIEIFWGKSGKLFLSPPSNRNKYVKNLRTFFVKDLPLFGAPFSVRHFWRAVFRAPFLARRLSGAIFGVPLFLRAVFRAPFFGGALRAPFFARRFRASFFRAVFSRAIFCCEVLSVKCKKKKTID